MPSPDSPIAHVPSRTGIAGAAGGPLDPPGGSVEASPDAASAPSAATSPQQVAALTDHLFRHEAGKLVSVLTGLFGIDRLHWAEDVVQEALVRALKTWPYYGIPRNPAAWLTHTAKNLALDLVRREKLFSDKQPQIIVFIEQWAGECSEQDSPAFDNEIRDGRLRLMFACCHPLVPRDAQAALALKTLCGFSPVEIARAFLTTEAAIAKRLTRARQKIRDLNVPFEIPAGTELAPRLEGVLETLYLLFNEGYKASSGDHLVRAELCGEALRLVTALAAHPAGQQPRVHALAALMYFTAARLPARTDADGNLLLLRDQDRAKWDRSRIAHGLFHLAQSAAGDHLSPYHLQAGIAASHCLAPTYADTDWARILTLYDEWVRLDPSPVVALNRAVALAEVHGPAAAESALAAIADRGSLTEYYLFHAVRGDLAQRQERWTEARRHYGEALRRTSVRTELSHLQARLHHCEDRAGVRAAA